MAEPTDDLRDEVDPGSLQAEASRGEVAGDAEPDDEYPDDTGLGAAEHAEIMALPDDPPLAAPPPPIADYKTGTLRESRGPYRAGLTVTTDPARPSDPKARSPIYVDPGRFATWERMGAFAAPEEKKKTGKAAATGKAEL